MSFWKIAVQAASDAGKKVEEALQPKRPTQDLRLPLGGRIGGFIKVNEASLLSASVFGSFITPPETGEVKISAISRVRLDGWPDSLAMHRYYLATGDGGEKERYIQVMTSSGELKEAVYFTSLVRLYPSDPEMLKYYSGELGDDGIGGREWVFAREDLEGILSASQFKSLPASTAEVSWQRAIGEGDHFSPIHGTETRIDDAVGDGGVHQEIWCMPHTRVLEGSFIEHLFVSLEVMNSHDGKREQEVHVDFMVGIPLSVGDFQII